MKKITKKRRINKPSGEEIVMAVYREMYKKAQPPADIDKIIKSGESKKPDWYMRYYLSDEEEERIIQNVAKKYNLGGHFTSKLRTETLLGSAPTSNREAWKKARGRK